jgi:hypothetical protein
MALDVLAHGWGQYAIGVLRQLLGVGMVSAIAGKRVAAIIHDTRVLLMSWTD